MGVISDGSYGIEKGLVFSYPVTICNGQYTIVQNLTMDDWAKEMIEKTQNELVEEKNDALKATNTEWLDGPKPKAKLWTTIEEIEMNWTLFFCDFEK